MPDWLKAVDKNAHSGELLSLPAVHLEALSMYRRAEDKNADCATKLAELYETGQLPFGVSYKDALRWHKYATDLGSIKSKLRLVQLYFWLGCNELDTANAIEHAKELVAYVVMAKLTSHTNVHAAAISAKLLLQHDAKEESIDLVTELLKHKDFINHPYHYAINEQLGKLNIKARSAEYGLKVITQELIEDGDFKLGRYKALEQPLYLISLPNIDLIKNTLDLEFPWFKDVNEIIYQQLVVQLHSKRPVFKLRPLLLAGPPGVG